MENDFIDEARKLDDTEIARHARVSTSNLHYCTMCFCCACVDVKAERKYKRDRIYYGIREPEVTAV